MKHGNTRTRVLLHVVEDPHPTVRSCMEAAGLKSTGTALRHLRVLRNEGLVDWVDGKRGSLHATVRPVPFGDDAA